MNTGNAGIEIFNDNNNLIVNAMYKNLELSRKIKVESLSVTTNKHAPLLKAEFDLLDGECLVAVKHESGDTCYGYISVEDKKIICTKWYTTLKDGNIPKNTWLYVFRWSKKTLSKSYGLQVFDEKGECVFDSSKRYMRVVYFGTNEKTLPAGKEYAVVQLGKRVEYNGYSHEMFPGNNPYYVTTMWYITIPVIYGNQVKYITTQSLYTNVSKERTVAQIESVGIKKFEDNLSAMVIDVTGL